MDVHQRVKNPRHNESTRYFASFAFFGARASTASRPNSELVSPHYSKKRLTANIAKDAKKTFERNLKNENHFKQDYSSDAFSPDAEVPAALGTNWQVTMASATFFVST